MYIQDDHAWVCGAIQYSNLRTGKPISLTQTSGCWAFRLYCSRQHLKLACLPYPDIALALISCCKFTKKLGLRRISHLIIPYSHISRIANVFTKFLPRQARRTSMISEFSQQANLRTFQNGQGSQTPATHFENIEDRFIMHP